MGFVDTVAPSKADVDDDGDDCNIPIIISNYSMDVFVGMRSSQLASCRVNFVLFSSISTIRRAPLTLRNIIN